MNILLTNSAEHILKDAHQLASHLKNPELLPSHLLESLLARKHEIAERVLKELGIQTDQLFRQVEQLNRSLPQSSQTDQHMSSAFRIYWELTLKYSQQMGDRYLSAELFLPGFWDQTQVTLETVLKPYHLSSERILQTIRQLRGGRSVDSTEPESAWNALEKYGKNLTKLAREHKLDPIIGRDQEVRRVIQILSRKTKNNPILIGEPGVGKTAIAEGLALRIYRGDVPELIKDCEVIALDIGALLAGAKFRGDFEERFRAVLKEVTESNGQIILFIDEIHTIVKAGGGEGSVDAGNLLKPALARGELRCIGATTLSEYRILEKDAALERRFQPVYVEAPNVEATIAILRGLKERYEIHHGVSFKDAALVAAAELSDRYISDRFLPDKAIDLMDEAASRLKIQLNSLPDELDALERKLTQYKMEREALRNENPEDPETKTKINALEDKIRQFEKAVSEGRAAWEASRSQRDRESELKQEIEKIQHEIETAQRRADYARASELKFGVLPQLEKELKNLVSHADKGSLDRYVEAEDIATVVSQWTGIPINRLLETEREKLMSLEHVLEEHVKGQDGALEAVANSIRLSRAGVIERSRPVGTFLFLGPTGVGKTETAKALARTLFNTEKAMIRIDMAEYMEAHSLARLIGSPPGYVGHEEGGQLTEAIRRRPYSIVLFDEIEKAHPQVLNVFLQILDDGRLTDGKGRTVSFENSILILTSNIGATDILERQKEFEEKSSVPEWLRLKLLEFMRPELLNRIDEIVVFKPLSKERVREIAHLQLTRLAERMQHEKHLTLKWDDHVLDTLVQAGFDPQFGARPMKRAITKLVEIPLSRVLLENEKIKTIDLSQLVPKRS